MAITYCGNVHPAVDLDSWLAAVDAFAMPVARRRRAAGREFGLGAWWPAAMVDALTADPAASARLKRELAARDLSVWTVNAFPYGDFHGAAVKAAVYEPDWSTEDRVLYTRRVAELAAPLAPPGAIVPLSTVPLAFTGRDDRVLARNLVRAASHLADCSERTGRTLVLALEPEPFCRCETAASAADFLEQLVFREGAWATVPEDVLRRHLGICVDLCHLAVVGEEPVAALGSLRRRGIAVPKVQVSACLELRDGAALPRLLAFDEPRYLHQTVAENGLRALDLPDVRRRADEFAVAGRLRTHFHVPVFWDDDGPLGSTRRELERVLPAIGKSSPEPLFEVETYTWSVLGGRFGELAEGLEKELEFADSLLVSS